MLIVLALAHQGEEFVLILPAILLVGALFILRWANAPQPEGSDKDAASDTAQLSEPEAADELPEAVGELQSVGGGERLTR